MGEERNLKNAKKLVEEFKGKIEIRKQEKLELAEEKNFREGRVTREIYGKVAI